MKYFYPKLHTLHNPTLDLSDGLPGYKHLEVASRVDLIAEGLQKGYKAEMIVVEELALDAVREIHDAEYLSFLLDISASLEEDEEYIPPVFRENLLDSPLYFRGGMYTSEIGTPIGKGSIQAALNSAQSAIEGIEYLLEFGKSAFVLTRPPGHHAGRRRYGGYSFFNNAYLCANACIKEGKRVSVVDIDYHIGDGSVEFACEEAPYYSLHANTLRNYPYLQTPSQAEEEFVTLVEFMTGISGEEYVESVQNLLERALKRESEVMILSLGFDTLETDYTQDEYIYVKAENFHTIGRLFGSIEQEVLILLEGGYDSEYLSLCAEMFISGFMEAKKSRSA